MANSGVFGAILTPRAISRNSRCARSRMKISTRVVERQHQRGLRPVDHEARGALRRAWLEEGGENIVAARADREDGSDRDVVFEIGRAIERIDRNAQRRAGIEDFRQFGFLRKDRRDRCGAQRAAHHLVGGKIDVLLLIAVGIDAAEPSGDAGQRPIGNQVGKLDRRGGDGLDHVGDRGPVGRARRRPDRDANATSRVRPWPFPCRRPLRGHSQSVLPVGSPPLTTTQFAKLVKFSYLLSDQSISYNGERDGRPVSCGN